MASKGNDISVMIASPWERTLALWLPDLARARGIALHEDSFATPAQLATHLEANRPLPEVLLLDKTFLDRLDARSIHLMRERPPHARVLLLGDDTSYRMVEVVLRHGFHGLLPTTSVAQICIKAIRAVSGGEIWLPRAHLAQAIAELWRAVAAPPDASHLEGSANLTRRQRQIVELLSQGCSNKEIALRLGIMEDTVKKHLQGVFGKLGVHRRTLVALHHRSGNSRITDE